MSHRRYWVVGGFTVVATVLGVAGAAWACIPVATLQASPTEVQPGQDVTVTGTFYGDESDVVLRLDELDGPALATVTPDDGRITATFTVPRSTDAGDHVLIATQAAVLGDTTWGVPSRTRLTVAGLGGAPISDRSAELLAGGDRTPGLVAGESVGTGELVLVALGTAGVAMFLAGGAALLVSSRRRTIPAEASR